MVGSFGEVLVMDWGIAQISDCRLQISDLRSVVGTRGYMAPEQERGEAVDARADVFSLGKLPEALAIAGRPSRLLAVRGAGPDHPVPPGFPEGRYLKLLLLATSEGARPPGPGSSR